MLDKLDSDLKIKSGNIYFPDPNNTTEVEKVIKELWGVNICFGEIGINGHIAFNEAIGEELITLDEFRKLRARLLDISKDTIIINSLKYGGYTDFIPRRCITIGMAEIFMTKKIRFYLEYNWQ